MSGCFDSNRIHESISRAQNALDQSIQPRTMDASEPPSSLFVDLEKLHVALSEITQLVKAIAPADGKVVRIEVQIQDAHEFLRKNPKLLKHFTNIINSLSGNKYADKYESDFRMEVASPSADRLRAYGFVCKSERTKMYKLTDLGKIVARKIDIENSTT